MKNYICINDQKISLSEEQVQQIRGSFGLPGRKLADVPDADTCKIGDHEMIVLEQIDGATLLLRKDPLRESQEFGTDNNYNGSYVDDICNLFSAEISAIVGQDNIILHDVDLTADDGLKDYGTIQRFASLLTAPQARQYVEILDKYKLDVPFWLATPWSTPTHDDKTFVKCVWPSGDVGDLNCNYDNAVRPFCILNSNIFVSQ